MTISYYNITLWMQSWSWGELKFHLNLMSITLDTIVVCFIKINPQDQIILNPTLIVSHCQLSVKYCKFILFILVNLFQLQLTHHCWWEINKRKFLMLWHLLDKVSNQLGCCPLTFVPLLFGGLLFGVIHWCATIQRWCRD